MRMPRTAKALLFAALAATGALAGSASASDVYMSNRLGQAGLINFYCDGVLVASNVFPQTFMMFPMQMAPGQHVCVVTPNDMALGQGDLMKATVTVEPYTTYTLMYYQDDKAADPGTAVLKLRRGSFGNG